MDVPRKDAARRKWIRRITFFGILVVVVPAAVIGLGRLKPAAPTVEGSSVWSDEVKRGPLVVNRRGLGTLVAEDTFVVTAVTDGRVERILIRPGAAVTPDSVILELKNPDLELNVLDTGYQIKQAEANLADLKVQLENQRLADESSLAQIQADFEQAKLLADRDRGLFQAKLKVELDYKISQSRADQLGNKLRIETERMKNRTESVAAQLAVRRTDIDKLKALYAFKQTQLDALKVRAGARGVLQELAVTQEGQRVGQGTVIAKVAQPDHLKAELKVAETQAKDVILGQEAEVDTHNGVIPGHVSRIDPAAKDGTVVVDVKLDGPLPAGARPDLSVDGVIEIERLADVLFVGRPAFGQPDSTVSMFKLDADGKGASRVQVKLGRSSTNLIEVVEGLNIGDKVILSDMSAYDANDRVRIN